jgi:hypothetical protein
MYIDYELKKLRIEINPIGITSQLILTAIIKNFKF